MQAAACSNLILVTCANLQVTEVEEELQKAHAEVHEVQQTQQALSSAAADSEVQAQRARDCQDQGEHQLAEMHRQLEVRMTDDKACRVATSHEVTYISYDGRKLLRTS